MTLRDLKIQCKSLIEKNKFEDLFELLSKNLKTDSETASMAILQKGRHTSVLQREMEGLLSSHDANVEYVKIGKTLLELLLNMQESELGAGGDWQDDLDQLVAKLPLTAALTPLSLVNCDRKKPARAFWRSFDAFEEDRRRFQFYYILSCPSQEPDGFSERMVYELCEKELEGRTEVNYKLRHDGLRLSIDPLPQGHNRQSSQNAFKKYFAERFKFTQTHTTFEEYLLNDLPKLLGSYVVTAFKMTASDWEEDETGPYLQWIMDTFSRVGDNSPTFLFFFVVFVKNAHKEEILRGDDLEALKGLRALLADSGNRNKAALIDALPPVPAEDLEYWLEIQAGVPDYKKDDILNTISRRLNPDEREQYLNDRLLNMERIQEFQEKVYQYHQHK